MSDSTGIEWTDSTWNPVVGCTKVSQGCKNCYAKELHDKRHKAYLSGAQLPDQYALPFEAVQLMPERLTAPLHWRKPRRVFVNSVSDLFHEDVPDEFIDRVFAVMALSRQHTFQVLTKRPERMRAYLNTPMRGAEIDRADPRRIGGIYSNPLPNVWLGTSVEDQAAADKRIPELLATPAAVRFLSCEPLLGAVELDGKHGWWIECPTCNGSMSVPAPGGGSACPDCLRNQGSQAGIDWVIVGGESGPGARPCDIGWIRSIVGQCQAAGVAVFVKQLGSKPYDAMEAWQNPLEGADEEPRWLRLRDRKGGELDEWPEDLRVREFPEVTR